MNILSDHISNGLCFWNCKIRSLLEWSLQPINQKELIEGSDEVSSCCKIVFGRNISLLKYQ